MSTIESFAERSLPEQVLDRIAVIGRHLLFDHAPSLECVFTAGEFPTLLTQVKQVNESMGGTMGAQLMKDDQGNRFVKKAAGGAIKADHLRTEYHTHKAYKALGVKVPEVTLYHTVGQDRPVMLSEFVPGQEVRKYLGIRNGNMATEEWRKEHEGILKEVQDLAKKSFVADCLLANYDVAGSSFDNMLIDVKNKVIWRVDNGSGMDYRAQGRKKDPKLFTAHIQEFQTLRDSSINPNTALLFETLTDQEIIEQIDNILPKREAFLAAIPDHLKEIMGKRFDNLKVYKQHLLAGRALL